MAITITHTTVATGTDAGNGEIRKAQWNEAHTVTGAAEATQAISAKTADFTFDATQAELLVTVNSASAVVATIPSNASVSFSVGTRIKIQRLGAGTVKISPGAGVTLRLPSGIRPNVFMGCKAVHAGNTGQNFSTDTAIPFAGTDAYDTHGFHDTATNNTRMTIPTGYGIKKVSLNGVVYASNVLTGWQVAYFKNSNDAFNYSFNNFYSTVGFFQMNIAAIAVPVADSSYVELFCRVESDTSIDFSTSTYFTLEVTEIDAQGWIAAQYGAVEIQKIDTNEWVFCDQSCLG